MRPVNEYTGYQFAVFRVLFGFYLVFHFATLIPYAGELFSAEGVIADPSLNPTHGLFLNILEYLSSPTQVTAFVSLLSFLSILFVLGIARPFVSFLLWYGWACLFNRNNLILNPSLPYVGWLLLASAVIPTGEPWIVAGTTKRNWKLPPEIFWTSWILLAMGYAISGFAKLRSPSWVEGTALRMLLGNPMARDNWLRDLLNDLPGVFLRPLTWTALVGELLFLPLALWHRTRPLIWSAMVFLNVAMLTVVNFADGTLGMLVFYLFTFDPQWIAPRLSKAKPPVVFFDGVCGLCNRFVDFLLEVDGNGIFLLSPLQGDEARKHFGNSLIAGSDPSTMILLDDGKIYKRSDAVVQILERLGGFWSVLSLLKIIPAPLRNAIYDTVAKYRYRWFGRLDSCRLPTPGERSRFLD